MTLNKEQILQRIDELECWPELSAELHIYLENAIYEKDIDYITALLNAGANPNPMHDTDCFLYYLLHEYQVEKSTKGDLILKIFEQLLNSGADANRVCSNNLRAYDYASSWGVFPVKELLEKYGADKKLRTPV